MPDEPLTCFVEIPKGSRNKYEFDHEAGGIKLDRFLFSSMVYPTDYGFIPDTLGLDGDPLDAMVCVSEPTFPGCLIDVKPIALFRMEDDKGVDDKVLCVPLQDPAWNHLEELDDLPDQLRQEIAHFFSVYKDLERKKVKVDGWYGREDALTEIDASRRRCAEHRAEGRAGGDDSLAGATPVESLSDNPDGPRDGAGSPGSDSGGEEPGSDSAGNEPAAEGAGHEPADRL
ncbi:MAG TPA: inorganic diphosphatase [Thermoleophilaceae bacterium]|jgi:inorganic pyrophosphatase